MKKVFLGLMAVLVSMTLFAERVSVEDAALVANNFMNVTSANSNVKKAVPAKRMVRKAMSEENLYYLYENADGEGWVIIAADDAVTPVLAYSNTGHFRTDNMPSNIRKWMGKYNNFIKKIEDDGVVASEETSEQWKKLRKAPAAVQATAVVGPLVKTTWDQDDPYYNLCPGTGSAKAYTGCVATAMAQVMNYWKWPKQGTGSRTYQPMDPNSNTGAKSKRYGQQTANFGATTYDWDNMCNSYSGSETSAQKTAVATLMFHCGVATDMMYGNDADGGSGTYTVNYGDWDWSDDEGDCAQNALYNFFGYKQPIGYMRDGYTYEGTKYYDKWTDAAWTAMVKEELDKQHPIMYAGAGDGGGHSFICDGYDTSNKFHFNWGWSGSNDGYYTLSNLAPGSGGAGGGSYDFSEDQDVIINIVPNRTDYPKVNVTWSVEGATTVVEYTQEDAISLPTAPADCGNGRKFVGWTKQSSVTGSKPTDLFTTAAGKTAVENVTYYAVFAELSSGEGAAAFDGVNGGSFKIYADVDGDKYYATSVSNNKIQSSTDESAAGTFTITPVTGGFTIKNSAGKYIKHGSQTNISAVTESYTWSISSGSNGTWRVGSQTSGRALAFRAGTYNVFGGYAISNIVSGSDEYFDLEIGGGSGSSYKNYSLSCDGAQGIENTNVEAPAAYKTLIDGRIVIVRGDAVYTLTGARVK